MIAYELLSKLRCLTLVGYSNGDYEWCGTDSQWREVQKEEDRILALTFKI